MNPTRVQQETWRERILDAYLAHSRWYQTHLPSTAETVLRVAYRQQTTAEAGRIAVWMRQLQAEWPALATQLDPVFMEAQRESAARRAARGAFRDTDVAALLAWRAWYQAAVIAAVHLLEGTA